MLSFLAVRRRASCLFLFAVLTLMSSVPTEGQFTTDGNGNLVFTGGNVSIGANATSTMKLRLRTTDTRFGIFLQNLSTSNTDTFGLRSLMGGDGNGTKFGVFSSVTRPQDFAGYFQGTVFFRDSVGIGIESPQAQLDLSDVFPPGGMNLRIGNDAFFTDIDRANSLGLFGNQDSSRASLQLANNGPVLTGRQGLLGLGTESPQAQLDLADVFPAGGMNLRIGNDTFFTDIDRSNTLGLFGVQNPSIASLQLGGSGPVLTGRQGLLGLGIETPEAQLDLADVFPAGGMNLRIGNDAFFTDVDRANTLGLFGDQDHAVGAIQLGGKGPVLWGRDERLGIVTSDPEARLHVARSSAILGEDNFLGADGDLRWLQNSNPSTASDQAVAVAIDDDAVFVAGVGAVGRWRIERRQKETGAQLYAVESNNQGATVTAIAIDDKAVYTVGHNDTTQINNAIWVIESRKKSTGAVNPGWPVTSDPSPNISNGTIDDRAHAIAVDESGVYVAGMNLGPGIRRQRIEKRNKTTGNLVTAFGGGVVEFDIPGGDGVLALAVDATGLYVVGHEGPSDRWTIRKLDRLTGNQIWSKVSVIPSVPSPIRPRATLVDQGALYVAGNEPVGNFDTAWRVEKRSVQTGDLVSGFGVAGVLIANFGNDRDRAQGLAADDTGLYIVGLADSKWRVEKRFKNNAVLVPNFGQNGAISRDPDTDALAAAADASGLYVVGLEDPTGDDRRWRMERIEGQISEFKGLVVTPPGHVGIGIKDPQRILAVERDSATDPIADRWETYSSRRWKTDVRPLVAALDTVRRLRGVSYRWKTTGDIDIGLVAEEVAEVLPEIVSVDEGGAHATGLDYGRLVPVLIEAVKLQQLQIDAITSLLCVDRPQIELCN